jgi:hypothetical protein
VEPAGAVWPNDAHVMPAIERDDAFGRGFGNDDGLERRTHNVGIVEYLS